MPVFIPLAVAVVAGTGAAVAIGKPKKLKNIGATKKAWLDSFIIAAKQVSMENNIPFQVCVAQAALESGWGKAAPGYNYFGIKGSGSNGSQQFVSSEVLNGKKFEKKMTFARYKSIADGIAGYCKAMNTNKLFAPASKNFSSDPVKYITWLWSSGYATGPNYILTVIGVMSVIYRATGNEDFNIVVSSDMKKLISKLKSAKANQRRNLAAKELNVNLSV
jgi:flagellum-specific peptidoglycan hydrolase FlgJ